ncbi:hypothetical protein ABES58_24160 [Paenibacillus lautus]|uniref:hypothetical protein n=1 Tax=Paenibacillus lautus TaxID=1401 RepID=UPI003D267CDB
MSLAPDPRLCINAGSFMARCWIIGGVPEPGKGALKGVAYAELQRCYPPFSTGR